MTRLGEDLELSDRGRRNGSSDVRTLAIWVSLVLTLGGLVFTAGYNWRRLDEVAAAQELQQKNSDNNYVRKDVEQQQIQIFETKLDDIKAQLAAVQRALERQVKP